LEKQEHFLSTNTKKPRFFYGYVVVFAGWIILLLVFGINYSFGVFFKPLIAEFGWARAVTSAAYSITTTVAGLFGIIAGKLGDQFGPRVVCAVSGAFLGIGMVIMSQIDAVWQLYVVYGLIVAAGIGGYWPVLMPMISRWFVTRKGLMTGILASGVAFGTILVPPLTSWIISASDWRTAYIIVGGGALVLITLISQLIRRNPAQIGQLPYGMDKLTPRSEISRGEGLDFSEAVRTRQFAIMCIIYFCFGFCLHSIMIHVVPHATDVGVLPGIAAGILSAIGLTKIVSNATIGGISDRLGVKPSLIISFALMFIALLWMQLAREMWMFYLFSVIFGLGYGGVITLQALMMTELFGMRSPGVILGTITFACNIGGSVGPFILGLIFDITGDYSLAFWITAVLAAAGSILSATLKPPVAEKQVS
jgi:MFS family permease